MSVVLKLDFFYYRHFYHIWTKSRLTYRYYCNKHKYAGKCPVNRNVLAAECMYYLLTVTWVTKTYRFYKGK